MPRPEGPTKIQRIQDLQRTLESIGALIKEPAPPLTQGDWYNFRREHIEAMVLFLSKVEKELSDALDSQGRLPQDEVPVRSE